LSDEEMSGHEQALWDKRTLRWKLSSAVQKASPLSQKQGQQCVYCLKQLSQQSLIILQIPFVFQKISAFMAQR
jgi:hypothetical protein